MLTPAGERIFRLASGVQWEKVEETDMGAGECYLACLKFLAISLTSEVVNITSGKFLSALKEEKSVTLMVVEDMEAASTYEAFLETKGVASVYDQGLVMVPSNFLRRLSGNMYNTLLEVSGDAAVFSFWLRQLAIQTGSFVPSDGEADLSLESWAVSIVAEAAKSLQDLDVNWTDFMDDQARALLEC